MGPGEYGEGGKIGVSSTKENAPKGGRVRFGLVGSFDNLNPYTFKGEAGSAVMNGT